jgi:hypothetical protein
MSKITERIAAETGVPRLVEILSEEVIPSDLQSLLLAVYQARSRVVRDTELLARGSPLTAPSTVDARVLNAFDRIAFGTAKDFEAVELSPVCPFGSSSALGGIDQNNVLTTIRNVEVLGDSTEALALECARRRKPDRSSEVRLACSHRVIRLQPFDVPGFTAHFRLFALVSAGRDAGSNQFEVRHLTEHVRCYLELCRALNAKHPLVEISDLRVTEALLGARGVSRADVRQLVRAHWTGGSKKFLEQRGIELPVHDPRLDWMEQRVFVPLRVEFPEAEFRFDLTRLEGLGYYSGLCLRISPQAADGLRYPVIDGGFTDWTARLLGDRKERLLTSGLGSEFMCRRFM